MVSRLTMSDRSSFIPAGSVKVVDKKSDAIAYLYTDEKGRPAFKVFLPKKVKEIAHYFAKNEIERANGIKGIFEDRQKTLAYLKQQDEIEAVKAEKNKLVVGDVLVSSWGYDQTNVDFYEVVGFSGKSSVKLRKIRGEKKYNGSMTGHIVPQSGDFIGEEFTKRWNVDYAKISSFSYARKWNTQTVAGVAVGPKVMFTEYA